MREMKDSGVEWLGEVPAGWEIVPGKRILTVLQRPVKEDDGVVTCFRDGEVTLRANRRTEGFTVALKEIGYQGVEPGDLVVHGMDGFAGSIGISDSRGKASPVLNVMDSDQDKRFLMYYMRGLAYRDVYMALSDGIRVRSCNLSWKKLAALRFALPPLGEQRRIADFLDEKCDQIDRAITSAEQSIQEYKAYRKGLIDEVSVHGLSPVSEKKKIGIPYVDWVPAHWTKAKFRFLLTEFVDCPHETPLYSPTGEYCVIRAGDQIAGGLVQGNMLRLEKDEYERRTRRLTLKRGDIVYGREGSWGKASFVPEDDRYCLGQRMMQFRCNENLLHPLFAAYVLNASYVYEQGRKDEVGSTSHHVNISTIASYRIALPPLDEQRRIADFLDERCAQIDRAVEAKQAIIDELKSYKKSLIYEVVTGKREV